MKKILLIEDRYDRQHRFKLQTGIDLEKYRDVLDNCIEDKYIEFLNEMLQGTYDLNTYDIIISHKSAFGDNNSILLKKIEDHCREYGKPFILFSGGIVGNYYNSEVYEVLELNSKTFYSQNLPLFLEAIKDKNENLLMLSYGKQWKANIILNILENLNLYIDTVDDELFKYIDMSKLEQIDIGCDTININDEMKKVMNFRDCLLDIVKDLIDE